MLEIGKQFMSIFKGLDRAYGLYSLKRKKRDANKNNKVLGQPSTIQGAVTPELWMDHLEGRTGIGIVPILDNSTCYFGAIDIDIYTDDLNLQKILFDIDKYSLPIIPCRTKSGGMHCYTFVKEAVSAALMKEKMSMFAALLGYGDSEIYPKQTEILSERGDIGQWINMPYFNGENTDRYAYSAEGNPLTINEFFIAVKTKIMSKRELSAFYISAPGDISDGPPCLQHLVVQGFSIGTRNDSLFFIAVYLKKAHPADWKNLLDDYNVKYMDPPLSSMEVTSIAKSIEKKDYNYACSKSPMKNHCDISLCRTREFGIGRINGAIELTGLTKYNSRPPVWFVDVEGGGRLELSTEDLQVQGRFQRRCMEALDTMPPILKPGTWRSMIQSLLENVNIIEAPGDASPKGMLFEYIERFCTSRAKAKEKEEILLGKPWTHEGHHYFRISDLMSFLDKQRFFEFKLNRVASILKEYGSDSQFAVIKGKGVNIWKIPEFSQQNEPFTVPKIDGEDDVF